MSIRSLLNTFKEREDTEHEQSLVRLAIITGVIIYFYVFSRFDPSGLQLGVLYWILLPYTAFGCANLAWIIWRPQRSLLRVTTFAVLDQLMCGLAIMLTGKWFVPLTFIVQIISIGVGLRFGSRYLYLSTAVAAVVGCLGVWFNPFWHSQGVVAAGYISGLILVPFYSAMLGGRLTRAHQQSEHRAELHRLRANTDTLTGLGNRAMLEEKLVQLLKPGAAPGAILLLDLDGFKAVNDTHGHATGDKVLVQVARTLESCVRASDVVARPGGDEFCILLLGANSQQAAQQVALKIIEAVNQLSCVGDTPISIGVSIGITRYPATDIVTPYDLLHTADLAMYSAKRAGKNRFAYS